MEVSVRAATVADAEPIGRLHVLAWQAAYPGQLPQHLLDGLDPGTRADQWRQGLSRPRDRDPVLVAEAGGEVVGFAAFGPAEAAGPDAGAGADAGPDAGAGAAAGPVGELYAINVRPDRWGVGAGGALLTAVAAGLTERGYRTAVLWVLPGNQRARAVYEHRGWRPDGTERTRELGGVPISEVRYRRDLP